MTNSVISDYIVVTSFFTIGQNASRIRAGFTNISVLTLLQRMCDMQSFA